MQFFYFLLFVISIFSLFNSGFTLISPKPTSQTTSFCFNKQKQYSFRFPILRESESFYEKVSDAVFEKHIYSTAPAPSVDTSDDQKILSVILTNIQSGNNIGRICRNCLAFNATEVFVVGKKDFHGKLRSSDKGARRRLNFRHCQTLDEVKQILNSRGTKVIGVEICGKSISIDTVPKPYFPNTAFMFGNEAGGLSDRQRQICDSFVYIPQFAESGMASINVACASAIVLHSFSSWANYKETTRVGEKFV